MSAGTESCGRSETINISSGDHVMVKAPFTRAIYVGSGGTVSVVSADDGQEQPYPNVPDGTVLPVKALRVVKANTTASLMVAMF